MAAPSPPEPVWKRPGWLTSIAGVISALFTIPGVIGDFLVKQQDVEIAKQNVEAARLGNIQSEQNRQFDVVLNTLAQQGTERVFMLRYLAAISNDEAVQVWAQSEVDRLDALVEARRIAEQQQQRIQEMEAQIAERGTATEEMKEELRMLRVTLRNMDQRIIELRSKSGIPGFSRRTHFVNVASIVFADSSAKISFGRYQGDPITNICYRNQTTWTPRRTLARVTFRLATAVI